MRTVPGRTDRVVVVGAGLAGLAAALHLAGRGRDVTLVERTAEVGGRCGRLALDGYTFDTGPTVLTMPELLASTLAAVGEDVGDWLELHRLDPAYRARFADGTRIDVHADAEAMEAELRSVCGPAQAAGYRRFRAFAAELYRLELRHFIDRNFDSPLELLTPALARLVALGGLRSLDAKVGTFLTDPRVRRLFTFQSMYAGMAPQQARALYAVISYMDAVSGVYYPAGGMHAVPRALAAAAEKHGVQIRLTTGVSTVETSGRRARAVVTDEGERIPADAVVLTADLPVARQELLDAPLRRPLRYAPSCVVLHLGARGEPQDSAHHTILFGQSWTRTFREIVRTGTLMSDPSLLVTNPTRTEAGAAPPGRHAYYVLAPAPNTEFGIDWHSVGPAYREELLLVLRARGFADVVDSIEVQHTVTPADWRSQGLAAGAPFALAHTVGQTGPFRPRNFPRRWDNVIFAGSATTPGVGVPMVLISGQLAADRITGSGRA